MDEIVISYAEIIDSLDVEEKDSSVLNDTNDAFVSKEVKTAVAEILQDVRSEEIDALKEYLLLSKKKEKLDYIAKCSSVQWDLIEKGNDGTCKKAALTGRIKQLQLTHQFPEDSFEGKLVKVQRLMNEEGQIKKGLKQKSEELHLKTKDTIETLDEDTSLLLLEHKWIKPLLDGLNNIPDSIIMDHVGKIIYLSEKYRITFSDVEKDIEKASKELAVLVGELVGDTADMEGLAEFQKILEV